MVRRWNSLRDDMRLAEPIVEDQRSKTLREKTFQEQTSTDPLSPQVQVLASCFMAAKERPHDHLCQQGT